MSESNDIVQRLIDMSSDGSHAPLRYEKDKRLASEAASEIKRLMEAVKRLAHAHFSAGCFVNSSETRKDSPLAIRAMRDAELMYSNPICAAALASAKEGE